MFLAFFRCFALNLTTTSFSFGNYFPTTFHFNTNKKYYWVCSEILLNDFFRQEKRISNINIYSTHVFWLNICTHFNYKSTSGYKRCEQILKMFFFTFIVLNGINNFILTKKEIKPTLSLRKSCRFLATKYNFCILKCLHIKPSNILWKMTVSALVFLFFFYQRIM